MANAAAGGPGHGAEFVCELHLHSDATDVARKITNRFTGLTGFLIDVNQQRGVAGIIDSNRGAQDFRLPHPIRGDVLLNCHDSLDVCVRGIKDAGRRTANAVRETNPEKTPADSAARARRN